MFFFSLWTCCILPFFHTTLPVAPLRQRGQHRPTTSCQDPANNWWPKTFCAQRGRVSRPGKHIKNHGNITRVNQLVRMCQLFNSYVTVITRGYRMFLLGLFCCWRLHWFHQAYPRNMGNFYVISCDLLCLFMFFNVFCCVCSCFEKSFLFTTLVTKSVGTSLSSKRDSGPQTGRVHPFLCCMKLTNMPWLNGCALQVIPKFILRCDLACKCKFWGWYNVLLIVPWIWMWSHNTSRNELPSGYDSQFAMEHHHFLKVNR